MSARCGECRYYDFRAGRGSCHADPPVWVGPSAVLDVDMLTDRWRRPSVRKMDMACTRYVPKGVGVWEDAVEVDVNGEVLE